MSRSLPTIITNAVSHWDAMHVWFHSHNDTHLELDEEFMQREIRKCILINHVNREELIKAKVKPFMDIYEKTTMVGRATKHLRHFSNRLNHQDDQKPTDEEIEEAIADHEKDLINNMLTDKF